MPTYLFRHSDGRIHQEFMAVDEMMQRTIEGRLVLSSGEVVKRDIAAEHSEFRQTPGNWPMKSNAMGCGEGQEIESMQAAAEAGVPTEFKNGYAIFTGPEHRKKYCEAYGYHDKNGGYSDPRKTR